jgi:hypothetical protein
MGDTFLLRFAARAGSPRLKMTRAFTFWQLPHEELAFLDFLETTGRVVAYTDKGFRTIDEACAWPIRDYFALQPAQCLLGIESPSTPIAIREKESDDARFLFVDLMGSCLIAYGRPQLRDGNLLSQSNVAAYLNFPNGTNKPDWFRAWVKRIINWLKTYASETCNYQHFPYSATVAVVEHVASGQIKLAF